MWPERGCVAHNRCVLGPEFGDTAVNKSDKNLCCHGLLMGEADSESNKYVSIAYVRGEGCNGEKQCREVDREGAFLGWDFMGLEGPE